MAALVAGFSLNRANGMDDKENHRSVPETV